MTGEIVAQGYNLVFRRPHLFYRHRAAQSEIAELYEVVRQSLEAERLLTLHVSHGHDGYSTLTIELGRRTNGTEALLRKLMNRRVHGVPPQHLIPDWSSLDLAPYSPFDLYAGSGLSSEAGIPVLSAAHLAFGVDDPVAGAFLFGRHDPIPARLSQKPISTLRQMVEIDRLCMFARPSKSHTILADLYSKGLVGKVFTDNIDDLFEQTGLSPVRTRGTGLFNAPIKVSFSSKAKSLLVIGISADRRTLIKQARNQGLKIIVINPALPVSPHSKNLDYLRPEDIFFRCPAGDVLPGIHENLLGSCRSPEASLRSRSFAASSGTQG